MTNKIIFLFQEKEFFLQFYTNSISALGPLTTAYVIELTKTASGLLEHVAAIIVDCDRAIQSGSVSIVIKCERATPVVVITHSRSDTRCYGINHPGIFFYQKQTFLAVNVRRRVSRILETEALTKRQHVRIRKEMLTRTE